MKRGYSYTTSFTITTEPSDDPLDLSDCTAKYCIGRQEFDAEIASPATGGVVEVTLTPAQTLTIPKGSYRAWCKVTSSDEIRSYGNHGVVVND